MVPGKLNRGFTLIEVLVVVAIIALLVSILLPSLDQARKQARMVVCQTNVRSLMQGFLVYATETKGFLPGNSESLEADWLGLGNQHPKAGIAPGKQPEAGTIFKYVGRQKKVYRCPDDDQYREDVAYTGDPLNANRNYSYTTTVMMSGANTAKVGLAHYRYAAGGAKNFDEKDHTASLVSTPAFIIVEEDYEWYIKGYPNSCWDNDDGLTDRHPRKRGNIGCIDGHVAALSLSPRPRITGQYFGSRRQCVRYGNKWVSGCDSQWVDDFYHNGLHNPSGTSYRAIERCHPASAHGVRHVGDS